MLQVSKPKTECCDNYVIVRTYSAGVFAGYLKEREGQEVILTDARRLWYWEGASSLSQLSKEGTSKPNECKFPCEVDEVLLLQAVEILPVTEKARKSIKSVPVWSS
jgi:hypothetical protein